jgi:hypothetical protein
VIYGFERVKKEVEENEIKEIERNEENISII